MTRTRQGPGPAAGRWRKLALWVIGGASGLLLGFCVTAWLTLALSWLDFVPGFREWFTAGFGEPISMKTVWMTVYVTALAGTLAGALYWLGKRMEG